METSRGQFSIVCLSSQDWHTPLPTNRQQIMARAARRGHRVLFVETGEFLGRHLLRALRGPARADRLAGLLRGTDVAPGIRACRLLNVLPFGQRSSFVNRVNWRIGGVVARREARRLTAPRVVWIYDPRGSAATGTFGEAFAVYDCVDDYPEQAAYSARSKALVQEADGRAAARARLVFATTRPLLERHRPANARTYLVPNGSDYEHFAAAADRSHADPEAAAFARPVLGFAGNLTAAKVDFAVLAAIARGFPEGTLVLVGPVERGAREALGALEALPNVRWLGPRPYAELPAAVAAFDVGLIPYAENDYTRSCFPLKLYEYLAAGKPVVASGLPELAGLEPHVVVADAATTVAAIESALARPASDVRARQELAARNTWDVRASRLLELVSAELAAP